MDKHLIDANKLYEWKKKNCSDCAFSLDRAKSEIVTDDNYDCEIQKKIDKMLIGSNDDLIPFDAIDQLFSYPKKQQIDCAINHNCPNKENIYLIDIIAFENHTELNQWFSLNCRNCSRSVMFVDHRNRCNIELALYCAVNEYNKEIAISRNIASKMGLKKNENFYPFNRLCSEKLEKE